MTREARVLSEGEAAGPALVLGEPVSFWGGVDPVTGGIIDRRHPDAGRVVTGMVLVMAGGRGSSSSSSILAEALRLGTAPAAIVLSRPDSILAVGALVASTLYGVRCPIVVCDIEDIETGQHVRVNAVAARGRVEVLPDQASG